MSGKLKTTLAAVILSCLASTPIFAKTCFLLHDLNADKILVQQGDIHERISPCSTFKIALALMGFESGIFQDADTPEWTIIDKGYKPPIDKWIGKHTPNTWLKHSVVPYSQILTKKMGADKFKNYLKQLEYGNQDISGTPGKDDGLTHCWLASSLAISPNEQLGFLKKLLGLKLPVAKRTQLLTRELLYQHELVDGWTLYGKTGSGSKPHPSGEPDQTLKITWFVGWIERDGKAIIFVANRQDEKNAESAAHARDYALDKINSWVENSN